MYIKLSINLTKELPAKIIMHYMYISKISGQQIPCPGLGERD